jgi:hypothetical protein
VDNPNGSPDIWLFQYQLSLYDLLDEVDNKGERDDWWRAFRHRRRMQPGERIYFLRAAGKEDPSFAAIVAQGTLLSKVEPRDDWARTHAVSPMHVHGIGAIGRESGKRVLYLQGMRVAIEGQMSGTDGDMGERRRALGRGDRSRGRSGCLRPVSR